MQHSRPFLINFLGLFEEVKKKLDVFRIGCDADKTLFLV